VPAISGLEAFPGSWASWRLSLPPRPFVILSPIREAQSLEAIEPVGAPLCGSLSATVRVPDTLPLDPPHHRLAKRSQSLALRESTGIRRTCDLPPSDPPAAKQCPPSAARPSMGPADRSGADSNFDSYATTPVSAAARAALASLSAASRSSLQARLGDAPPATPALRSPSTQRDRDRRASAPVPHMGKHGRIVKRVLRVQHVKYLPPADSPEWVHYTEPRSQLLTQLAGPVDDVAPPCVSAPAIFSSGDSQVAATVPYPVPTSALQPARQPWGPAVEDEAEEEPGRPGSPHPLDRGPPPPPAVAPALLSSPTDSVFGAQQPGSRQLDSLSCQPSLSVALPLPAKVSLAGSLSAVAQHRLAWLPPEAQSSLAASAVAQLSLAASLSAAAQHRLAWLPPEAQPSHAASVAAQLSLAASLSVAAQHRLAWLPPEAQFSIGAFAVAQLSLAVALSAAAQHRLAWLPPEAQFSIGASAVAQLSLAVALSAAAQHRLAWLPPEAQLASCGPPVSAFPTNAEATLKSGGGNQE
jgi:hypothetical protein